MDIKKNEPKKREKFSSIGFIQFEIASGIPEINLAATRNYLTTLRPPENALIVLPELWVCGFCYDSMQHELQRVSNNIDWIKEEIEKLAKEYGIYLAGTLPEIIPNEEGKFYNTLSIYGSDGLCGSSQKQHLFVGESQGFHSGKTELIATNNGNIASGICFDLRFPEVVRPLIAEADVLIYSAQWPKSRIHHWVSLLTARAIENQIFVVGCNASAASDGAELGGRSMIIAPDGRIIEQAAEVPTALMATVQWQEMDALRERFRSFP